MLPVRAAASTSSGRTHTDVHGPRASAITRRADDAAASYLARPLYKTAAAHWAILAPSPSPWPASSASLIVVSIIAHASVAAPWSVRSRRAAKFWTRLPAITARRLLSATRRFAPARSPFQAFSVASADRWIGSS